MNHHCVRSLAVHLSTAFYSRLLRTWPRATLTARYPTVTDVVVSVELMNAISLASNFLYY
jgi:hypothetical protein